jgi:hypothetical protein
VPLKPEVDTWLRFMADTVKSLFRQIFVVFACFGEADGFYRISEHSSGKTVEFWKKYNKSSAEGR